MSPQELEEKYKDELEVLRALPEGTRNLNIALTLKHLMGGIIAPMTSTPELLEVFMELLESDFNMMGYTITKKED